MKSLFWMLRLTCALNLADVPFEYLTSAEVESSWEMLTDKCSVELPRALRIGQTPLADFLKVGKPFKLELGYNDQNDEVFNGVIGQVDPVIPVRVDGEDAMWSLKQNRVTHQWKDASLKDIIKYVAPGYDYKLVDAQIGKYTIPEDWNATKVFEDLKSNYGLYTFFRDGKLQVGLQYDPEFAVTKIFDFEQNIIDHDLEFFKKENLRLKVKAISIGKDNKKTVIELGDLDGEERTMHFYNLGENELRAAAERELERLKYDGFRGSFTTFGKPYVRHGDIVELIDPTYDRNGKYWVDKVVRNYGMDGYRQKITIGPAT